VNGVLLLLARDDFVELVEACHLPEDVKRVVVGLVVLGHVDVAVETAVLQFGEYLVSAQWALFPPILLQLVPDGQILFYDAFESGKYVHVLLQLGIELLQRHLVWLFVRPWVLSGRLFGDEGGLLQVALEGGGRLAQLGAERGGDVCVC